MKIVVTGAAGRVGRAVLADLKAAGNYTVTSADRTIPPSDLTDQSLLTDLSDAGSVYGALTGADAVIHLGAYPDTSHHPGEEVFINNCAASANVAAACIAFGIKRIVYASSITTYGLGYQARNNGITVLPTDETVSTWPDDFYSLSKHAGEDVFTLGASEHNLQVASLRIARVIGEDEYQGIGPRDNEDASFGLWSYVDARDVAQAARLAIERSDAMGPGNHTYNIGAADSHTVAPLSEVIPKFVPELAELAASLKGTEPAYGIAKAQEQLGYEPRRTWREERR
ncbi:MAG: NAD(P)-dependent oxidoreductase [Gemmatimonadetes bacterium]|jgi:nucleoside-diphosphate-sugar epimerase|nr:NAD(P)-dependent oxidoreductase [Gemmatimonadota bacterium]MBT7456415.1 NAD(P)-dependent oxidoreductase [Gemmatimonadota bacterium]